MVLTASHSSSLRCEMVGRLKRGQHAEHGLEIVLVHVEHEADLAERVDGALEQHADVLELAALLGVLPGGLVGDQLGVGFEHGIDDFELVGAQGGAGLGDFDDGVGEHGRLDFGGAPTEFDLGLDAVLRQVAFGGGDQLGGDDLAFEIVDGRKAEASGTASTQRTLPKLCLA